MHLRKCLSLFIEIQMFNDIKVQYQIKTIRLVSCIGNITLFYQFGLVIQIHPSDIVSLIVQFLYQYPLPTSQIQDLLFLWKIQKVFINIIHLGDIDGIIWPVLIEFFMIFPFLCIFSCFYLHYHKPLAYQIITTFIYFC